MYSTSGRMEVYFSSATRIPKRGDARKHVTRAETLQPPNPNTSRLYHNVRCLRCTRNISVYAIDCCSSSQANIESTVACPAHSSPAPEHPWLKLHRIHSLVPWTLEPRGPSVEKHLLSCLPSPKSNEYVSVGLSPARKTPLIEHVEKLLGSAHHAGTFSKTKQHAPVAQLDESVDAVAEDPAINTLVSMGGGSLTDSAKAVSYRKHRKTKDFPIPHSDT